MFRRMPNDTQKQMLASGSWIKVARKHYRHVSGVEVKYDCNQRGWEVSTKPGYYYSVLWAARYEAERAGSEIGNA